jgi:hypothetical protein
LAGKTSKVASHIAEMTGTVDLDAACTGGCVEDDVNKPPFDLGALSISFSGCGFLGIYHMGVVAALRQYIPGNRIFSNQILCLGADFS